MQPKELQLIFDAGEKLHNQPPPPQDPEEENEETDSINQNVIIEPYYKGFLCSGEKFTNNIVRGATGKLFKITNRYDASLNFLRVILYKFVEELRELDTYYSANSNKFDLLSKIYRDCCKKMDENVFYNPTEDELNAMMHENIYNEYLINMTKTMNLLYDEMSKIIYNKLAHIEESLELKRYFKHFNIIDYIMNSIILLIALNNKMIIHQIIKDKYPSIAFLYDCDYEEILTQIPIINNSIKENIDKFIGIDKNFHLSFMGFYMKCNHEGMLMREYIMRIFSEYDMELLVLQRKRIAKKRELDITKKLNEEEQIQKKNKITTADINEVLANSDFKK